MPRVRRQNVPPALFQHLLDRVQIRKIPPSQLELLPRWLDSEPEVPRGSMVQAILPHDRLWGARVDQDLSAPCSGVQGPACLVNPVQGRHGLLRRRPMFPVAQLSLGSLPVLEQKGRHQISRAKIRQLSRFDASAHFPIVPLELRRAHCAGQTFEGAVVRCSKSRQFRSLTSPDRHTNKTGKTPRR